MPDERDRQVHAAVRQIALVVSGDVPEPTSYSGRNYIDLGLMRADFAVGGGPTATPDAPAAPAVPLAWERNDEDSIKLALRIPARERIGPELLRLDPAEVANMRAAGKEFKIYPSLHGELTYNYVESPPTVGALPAPGAGPVRIRASGGRPSPVVPGVPGGPPSGSEEEFPEIIIYSPKPNETIRDWRLIVSGTTTELRRLHATAVRVKVGDRNFENASTTDEYKTWSFEDLSSGSGTYTIVVEVTWSNGVVHPAEIPNVRYEKLPQPPPVAIAFPTATDPVLLPPESPGIVFRGTAAPAERVTAAWISFNQGGQGGWVPVRRVGGTWAQWQSDPIRFAPGPHSAWARADFSDGRSELTPELRFVVVGPGGPPPGPPGGPTGPKAEIVYPGAKLRGPTGGMSLYIEGTVTDPGRVASVEVYDDKENPSPVEAHPKNGEDWASGWVVSAPLRVATSGPRIISARCTDKSAPPNVTVSQLAVTVELSADFAAPRVERLLLVESCRLSSFRGAYGTGQTLKTFTLLPGEKTRISVRSYTRTEATFKEASSILDSFTTESASDFETSLGAEQTDRRSYEESFEYGVQGSAEARWGWGSAQVSAEVKGATNRAREEFSKNVSNATQKHAAKASAKREVQINTSHETRTETGEETAIEREVENINVSRTLNFVFRQMNQKYVSVLHLVDARVAYYLYEVIPGRSAPRKVYREVALPQLDALLGEVIVEGRRAWVKDRIVGELSTIFNYRGDVESLVEEKALPAGATGAGTKYWRVKRDLYAEYEGGPTGPEPTVQGIILAVTESVLRTDGVMADAILGEGDALDAYSHGLQDEAIAARRYANRAARIEQARHLLAARIIKDKDAEAAKLLALLYPQHPPAAAQQPALPVEDSDGQPR